MKKIISLLLLIGLIYLGGCAPTASKPYDANTTVPKGDPAFPPLENFWVIDKAGVLSQAAIDDGDAVCQRLKEDGIAEVVVVIIKGVKQPDLWATHYGRWLKLGSKGYSTEGGNNGVVWLVRPDAKDRITISVGRGLPEFSTVDYGEILDDAKDYINFNNFDKGVSVIIKETDETLRKVKIEKGNQK